MHGLGYLHLDIKPDNILLGSTNESDQNYSILHLIDFGISKRYFDSSTQKHIPQKHGLQFQGNIVFASKTAFEGKGTNYHF